MRMATTHCGESDICVQVTCRSRVWDCNFRADLMAKHAEKPFHALVGGGDQLYCDA